MIGKPRLTRVQINLDKNSLRSNLTNQQAQRQTGTVPRESSLPKGEEIGKFVYEIYVPN